jgi:hypothetical protein
LVASIRKKMSKQRKGSNPELFERLKSRGLRDSFHRKGKMSLG